MMQFLSGPDSGDIVIVFDIVKDISHVYFYCAVFIRNESAFFGY